MTLRLAQLSSLAKKTSDVFFSAWVLVGLVLSDAVRAQEVFSIGTGIDTTLAQTGLFGPDAPHGQAHPEGALWEFDIEDPAGGGQNHGLVWFDIADSQLAEFNDGTAWLELHVSNSGGMARLYRVTVDWLSDPADLVTWNNMPGGPGIVPGRNARLESHSVFPESVRLQGSVVQIDVSADVRAWAFGEPNYGWAFLPVDTNGTNISSFESLTSPVPTLTLIPGEGGGFLQAGDADQDFDFDQLDLVRVQIAARYRTGQPATWGQGDWNAAPGGTLGDPPIGDGLFDQRDIIAALRHGLYLTGPYASVTSGVADQQQISVGYRAGTGEIFLEAAGGAEPTSIWIKSSAGILTGRPALGLGGIFDSHDDGNLFKATFGSTFGSLSFGPVAQIGLSEAFLVDDLTFSGSRAGGGQLDDINLNYIPVPEPPVATLALLGLLGLGAFKGRAPRAG